MKTRERYKINIPIEFRDEKARSHKGILDNISIEGMCFNSMKHLNEGKNLDIFILKQDMPVKAAGTVMWCKRSTKHYQVGVKFSEAIRPVEIESVFSS